MLKKIAFIFFLSTYFYLLVTNSHAIELQSPRFKIDLNQLEVNTEKQSEPVSHTIESLYGAQKFNEFNSNGFMIFQGSLDDAFGISLSDSLILISESNKNQRHKIEVAGVSVADAGLNISMIQEYPLRNFADDSIDLEYSIKNSGIFRSLPDQKSGQTPTLVLQGTEDYYQELYLMLGAQKQSINGTYETIINFIASPDL